MQKESCVILAPFQKRYVLFRVDLPHERDDVTRLLLIMGIHLQLLLLEIREHLNSTFLSGWFCVRPSHLHIFVVRLYQVYMHICIVHEYMELTIVHVPTFVPWVQFGACLYTI